MKRTKQILLDLVEYEMLLEIATRERLRPEQFLKRFIQKAYQQLK